jgi:hypothetical protein
VKIKIDFMPIQLQLLTKILQQLQVDTIVEEIQLKLIFYFLFDHQTTKIDIADQQLMEAVHGLKDIITTDNIKTLEGVLDYFEEEKSAVEDYMSTLIEKNDRREDQNLNGNSTLFLSYCYEDASNLHRIVVEHIRPLNIMDDDIFFPLNTTYARPFKTYLDQFTEQVHNNMLFIYSGHGEINVRKTDQVFWKINHGNHSYFDSLFCRRSLFDVNVTLNYDKVLEKISSETPFNDISVKVRIIIIILSCNFHNAIAKETDNCESEGVDFSINHNCDTDSNTLRELYSCTRRFFINRLADKKWAILKSPRGYSWLTSDNPGFVIEGDEVDDGQVESAFIWDKLQSRHARLYYPLSRNYCLRIQSPDKEAKDNFDSYIEFEESSEEEWYSVNEKTYMTRREMVIASQRDLLETFRQNEQ